MQLEGMLRRWLLQIMPTRNRNTAGGGNQTNINGDIFEEKTSLITAISALPGYTIKKGEKSWREYEVWCGDERVGVIFKGKRSSNKAFYDFLKNELEVDTSKLTKSINPDQVFYNERQEKFYVIECKYQDQPGSVDEKLQTFVYKRSILNYLLFISNRDETIDYLYVLNKSYFGAIIPESLKLNKDKYTNSDFQFRDVFKFIRENGSDYFFDEVPLHKLGIY